MRKQVRYEKNVTVTWIFIEANRSEACFIFQKPTKLLPTKFLLIYSITKFHYY